MPYFVLAPPVWKRDSDHGLAGGRIWPEKKCKIFHYPLAFIYEISIVFIRFASGEHEGR